MKSTYTDKYKPMNTQPESLHSPLGTVITAWSIFIVLACYGAQPLYASMALDDRVRGRSFWLPLTERNLAISDALGLSDLYRSSSALSERMNQTPVLLSLPSMPEEKTSGTQKPDRTPEKPAVAPPAAWHPDNGLPTPRRILLIGASSIQFYLGADLERKLEEFDGIQVYRLGKLSTGLTRPDLFDWFAKLDELKAQQQPDVVMALFGGNDCQPMHIGQELVEYATDPWNEAYTERLTAFVRKMQAHGSTAVLIGNPIMRQPAFSERLRRLNELIERVCRETGAIYLPTWDLTTDSRGRYRKTISHKGETGLMRLKDGIHYSRLGSRYVSNRLVARLQRRLNLIPEERELSLSVRFDLSSTGRKEATAYQAYVPQRISGRLPVVFLLHGAEGSWQDWPEHAHEQLQRLASEHQLVLVVPDGRREGWYLDSPLLDDHQLETTFFDELLPDVERRLPVSSRRGIAGLSMGGHGALGYALRHPGTFSSASSMSGVLDLTALAKRPALIRLLGPYQDNPALWQSLSVWHLMQAHPDRLRDLAILLSVGQKDRYFAINRRVHEWLGGHGIDHAFHVSDGGHTWDTWIAELPRHLAFHAEHLVVEPVAIPGPASETQLTAAEFTRLTRALNRAAKTGDTEPLARWQAQVGKRAPSLAARPLHLAAERGLRGIVSGLLDRGTPIDAVDLDGDTALHLAAQRGHAQLVEELIERGANMEKRNRRGATPLHLAARKGRLKSIQALLQHKAAVNAVDDLHRTALHWAARFGFLEVVEQLIAHGADPSIEDKNGQRAENLAPIFVREKLGKIIGEQPKRASDKPTDDKTQKSVEGA